jgi:hypothetical protein
MGKRTRKPGLRQPNGKLRRPTLEQLKHVQEMRDRENQLFVGDQPHRRDLPDPLHHWGATALGRFCLRHRLRSELFHAGEKYEETWRRFITAKGVPDHKHHGGMGSGLGPSDETVNRWEAQIEGAEEALRRAQGRVYIAMRHLCLDDADLPATDHSDAIVGLRILAERLVGLPVSAHPFVNMAA